MTNPNVSEVPFGPLQVDTALFLASDGVHSFYEYRARADCHYDV